ncbi:MAG TPA: hydantoinase/oxoprolinase family protein, partial [Pseudonocardiaceae bacterium]|nr:hydantoinase/oxoprolinase family protein [Pseudonocardiaceae bacterium]
ERPLQTLLSGPVGGAIASAELSRGIEPRDSGLVAFGGAGPMHAVFLARELGIAETIVPRFPGAFSAWGMLQTRIRKDVTEPYFFLDADLDGRDMSAVLTAMERDTVATLADEGVPPERRTASHAVDIRYAAQEYTLTVPLTDAAEPASPDFLKTIAERFAELHKSRYGHANLGAPIEFVTLRSTAFGDLGRPEPQKWPRAESADFPHQVRQVVFGGERRDTVVARRDDLFAGHRFAGPAVIVEDTATTVVPPDHEVTVDDIGSLIIRAKEQA